jgi:glycosyltransferase involved in cell wall biosynthesis
MHLVFVSTLYEPPWGGSENLWSSAAMRALEQGHRVSIFVSVREKLEAPLERLKEARANLYFWKPKYPSVNFLHRVVKKLSGCKLPEWEWWHRNIPQDADVICLNQGGALCGPMRHGLSEAIMATGKPYVVLARADTGFEYLTEHTRPHARRFFEGARAFVSASQSAIDLLRLYLASNLPNARVLHSPLADYGEAAALDTQHSTLDFASHALNAGCSALDSSEVIEMACVGRLRVADKGQHLLLAALAEEPWRSRPYRLSFYGDGPDRKYLEELMGFYGLAEKVYFAGHTKDVGEIWIRSHLAVQPSFVEGAPQSLLEAMLCRRPCVATAVSGIPEWVEKGRTGFLAEAPTVHYLRLALERAWENRHRWREIGEAAREACLAKRDPDPGGTLLRLLKAAAEAEN